MSNIIADGEGSGNSAGVTVNKRLKTTGIDLSLTEAATESGDTYNINTGEITLTSDTESGIIYLKNNEDTNLIIDNLVVNIKDYTGTDGQPEIKIYRNPTAGTLITEETASEISNRNFGSNKLLAANYYQGGDSKTISGEDNSFPVYLSSTAAVTFHAFTTLSVLPRGASIAISYKAPSGVTSMKIIVAFNVTLNGTQL